MLVVGLISGTSVDGIDAALVEITGCTFDLEVNLLAHATYPYPPALRTQILEVCAGAPLSIAALAELDDAIADCFAQAALQVQADRIQSGQPGAEWIGSHGQTVFHRPPIAVAASSPAFEPAIALGYSLQLGRGEWIAHRTGIPTVSNFRAADLAAGGQGAPMVPPVDACLLSHPDKHRCVQNLGGIGNVAYLPARGEQPTTLPTHILGWDTGPGNVLIDLAVQRFSQGQQTYDRDGAWAAQGTPCLELVQQWLQQEFFQQSPPKSTGRELFSPAYLDRCLQEAQAYNLSSADILATLTELTALSIVDSYRSALPKGPDQVLLCGGGSRNHYLKQRLALHLAPAWVGTTDEVGLNADAKEAIAFAVLAYWRIHGIPGNLPEVTGASRSVILGEIHLVA